MRRMARVVARLFMTLVCVISMVTCATAADAIDRNVVYGMYSGTALLVDVHHPTAAPNGRGLIVIIGGGWMAGPMGYGASPMKDNELFVATYVVPFVQAGYTVFAPNYRGTPRFPFPAGIDDLARLVRFVRGHAADYKIDPNQLGAVGGSAGAYYSLMLGTHEHEGARDIHDPIDALSAKVQAVVSISAATDLTRDFKHRDTSALVASFLGGRVPPMIRTPESLDPIYRVASPITYVSKESAPTLLIHGEADDILPIEQSEIMLDAFRGAHVPCNLIRVPNAGHTFSMDRYTAIPNYFIESVRWFDQQLKVKTH
jgi:dipeptidyl aminopeptidase/acylaminoacyl peptidase